jgi:hypothetical protein
MDPLSITVFVSSLLMVAAKVVKSISDVRDRYKDAAFMLASIASEVAVIHASLAHLQNSMLADVQTLASRLTPQNNINLRYRIARVCPGAFYSLMMK